MAAPRGDDTTQGQASVLERDRTGLIQVPMLEVISHLLGISIKSERCG